VKRADDGAGTGSPCHLLNAQIGKASYGMRKVFRIPFVFLIFSIFLLFFFSRPGGGPRGKSLLKGAGDFLDHPFVLMPCCPHP
jgi:hypothetical protein